MSNMAIDGVLYHSQMRGSARLLMFAIANAANINTDRWALSIDVLATHCKCTPRYVQKLVPKCVAAGELVVIDRPGYASEFHVPILPGEPGYAPAPCGELAAGTHFCNGEHTPLSITRHSLQMAAKDAYDASVVGARQRKRVNDSSGVGVNHSSPQGRTIVHPPVNAGSPPYMNTRYLPEVNPIHIPDAPSDENENHQSVLAIRDYTAADDWSRTPVGKSWCKRHKVNPDRMSEVMAAYEEWNAKNGEVRP